MFPLLHEYDDKPTGKPVEGCPVCKALCASNVPMGPLKVHDDVMKHVMEEHDCRAPHYIDGMYYLQEIFITVVVGSVRGKKYSKEYITAPGFWIKDSGWFEVYFKENKSTIVYPKDVFRLSIDFMPD